MTTIISFQDFISEAKKSQSDYEFRPLKSKEKTKQGHEVVGATWTGPDVDPKNNKGVNILKHKETGKFFAAGGSSNAVTKSTTMHDSPEEAAEDYHSK